MPRNRRPQDREKKRAEIVAAAARLFVDEGYDQASMSQIASAAGVTTNTIYWYVEDKDDLLVEVLNHVMAQAMTEYVNVAEQNLGEQMLWVLSRLEVLHRLVTVVHSRTSVSLRVDAWHTGFHQLVETLLADGLRRAGAHESDIPAATDVGVFVIEGLLTHPRDEASKRALIEVVTSAIIGRTTREPLG